MFPIFPRGVVKGERGSQLLYPTRLSIFWLMVLRAGICVASDSMQDAIPCAGINKGRRSLPMTLGHVLGLHMIVSSLGIHAFLDDAMMERGASLRS